MQDKLLTAIPTLRINKIGALRVLHVSAEERIMTITVGCYETRTRQFLVLIDAIPDGEAEVSCWPQSLNTLHALGKSGSHLSLKGEDNLVSDAALSDRSAVECGFEKTNLQASPESAPVRTIETFERSWPGIDIDNFLREPRREYRDCPEGRGVTERREIVIACGCRRYCPVFLLNGRVCWGNRIFSKPDHIRSTRLPPAECPKSPTKRDLPPSRRACNNQVKQHSRQLHLNRRRPKAEQAGEMCQLIVLPSVLCV